MSTPSPAPARRAARLLAAALLLAGCRPDGPLVRSGQVYATSTPADATVHVDGVNRGQTPITVSDIPPGEHLLRVGKPGYRDAWQTVVLKPGERLAADWKLEPLTTLLLIHTQPAGADIDMDAISVGKAPLLLRDVPLGQRRLTARAAGFLPRTVNVAVEDQTPQKVVIALTSDSASLSVASEPKGALVNLDGAAVGKAPLNLPAVASGKHLIELTLPGHSVYRSEFTVQAGERRDIQATLVPMPGKLTVRTAAPGARLFVNDAYKTDLPATLELPAGTYALRVEAQGYDPWMATNVLAIGAEANLDAALEKSSGTILLSTEPAGVSVFLDGESRGVTRGRAGTTLSDQLAIEFVPRGTHALQLTRTGYYDVTRPVEVQPKQTIILHEKLRARPVPFVPTVIVRTGIGPEDTFRGIIRERYDNGDIRLEIEPGIFKTLNPGQVLSIEPIPGATP